ncbi:MAG: alpha-amylase family glycosyl hydrolase [Bacteroidota bacterium]|nr:alpha-amylase family glycosyl hydrolase [Bacteroidota bacterium]
MKKISSLFFVVSFLLAQTPSPYAITSARSSEEWVKKGIIYEIFPRQFSNEGNFSAIEHRIPELKKLGVTILWLMPIYPVGIEKRKGTYGSPYSVKDYYGINPEYGTLRDFKKLISSAHKHGLKIIIDIVANHTSWDSRLMKEHPEWFTKDSTGKFIPPVPDWTDVVDLDYSQPGLRRYMIDMLKYWVHNVGVDGFRCDVAEMVPTDFWNEARAALDSLRPIMMLSEGQYPEHHVKAFDLTYSWNFYQTINAVIKNEKPAAEFDSTLAREALAFPKNSLRMRFSSNHDENAWDNPDVIKFGDDGAKLAAVLVNTFPGVPLLYDGQEVGNEVKLGLFEKFNIDWKKGKDFRDLYKKLFALRKKNPALSIGEFEHVSNSNSGKIYSFIRSSGKNKILVVLNFSDKQENCDLTLNANIPLRFSDAFSGKKVDFKNVSSLILPKFGYRIFVVQ